MSDGERREHILSRYYRRILFGNWDETEPELCQKCNQPMKFVVENDNILRRAFYHCEPCDDWIQLWQEDIMNPTNPKANEVM